MSHSVRKIKLMLVGFAVASGLACESTNHPDHNQDRARAGVTATTTPEISSIAAGQTLYVPVYSHVYTADQARPLNLATTVFVRNTNQSRPIIVTRAEYFDSGGKSIRSLLKAPLKIEPMASVDFFVKESDESGGASPSFLIQWVATETVNVPIVEAVMIGTTSSQGISFTTQGREVKLPKQ